MLLLAEDRLRPLTDRLLKEGRLWPSSYERQHSSPEDGYGDVENNDSLLHVDPNPRLMQLPSSCLQHCRTYT